MRCKKCKVDLPESYQICPLCGEKAVNEPSKLAVSAYVPYSKEPVREQETFPKEKSGFSIEKVKAYFSL
ncbi:MAG: hypothetical protein ACI4XE_07855 [Acutalibacteraceae bacterium]